MVNELYKIENWKLNSVVSDTFAWIFSFYIFIYYTYSVSPAYMYLVCWKGILINFMHSTVGINDKIKRFFHTDFSWFDFVGKLDLT